ncbi:hypothetical protein BV22DRAFT_1023626 [Leucogyrophana mollusca]|uniref:Uncharacterized protein n=1 Tax=Leucogyrophana mollusca TaxID=85980 RepID=A0ACB8B068_9AGAM|nr:hypothetical protein BV22DRAFT_1023626 [Leucogyrophana mollusca]
MSTDSTDSDSSGVAVEIATRIFDIFRHAIVNVRDDIEMTRVLNPRPKISRAPQLHLLEEWALDSPEKFRRALRMDPRVFGRIVEILEDHPVFHNNSNNAQLAVAVQVAIFINAAGHYGNRSATEDYADWAGVSIGTVYNCFRRVMVAILDHHDEYIHWDQNNVSDMEEKEKAKRWCEARTCREWRGGYLSVDGSPFNLFQKPGWHGEVFFDRKSNYSLTAQVRGCFLCWPFF